MRDGRRRHEDEALRTGGPGCVEQRARPGDVDAGEVGRVPGERHLRCQVHHGLHPVDGRARRRRCPSSCRGRPRPRRPRTAGAGTSYVVPASRTAAAVARPRKPLAPVTRTLTADHPATADHRRRPPREPCAVDLRVVPDVRRQDGTNEHRGERDPGGRTDGGGEVGGASPGRRAAGTVSTTATTCCVPAGPVPANARAPDTADALDALFGSDRGDDPVGGRHDVLQPALDPQTTVDVEVPHVTRPVSARVVEPEPGHPSVRQSRS